jgi:hypothetical protein
MEREDNYNIGTLALDYINYTHRNIFLTGGAGTGKTTFLQFLKKHSQKKLAIAAPTGVAAINAGGTTIHALFGFPPRPLNSATVENIRLTGQAQSLLRELELLVIDEASMLRADVLDAMDYLLKKVRQDIRPLGGLQILLIGDLYQLPPIENHQDRDLLQNLYPSLFFLDAKIFSSLAILKLELTEVYRQTDPVFVKLLEAVRKGIVSNEELSLLNGSYCPGWAEKDAIILTTHNRTASQLNDQQMNNLQGNAYNFVAEIRGEFLEDQFPVNCDLQLKVGCRVMVVKNDNSINRQFYNGKIGWVTTINDQVIGVKFDDGIIIALERETWSNIAYTTNGEKNSIKEEILGTFKQFPIKLAWAITIHKSQGLTFEKAIIDVGNAFAPGQVYVALSRIKTIGGVFLKSKIPHSAIIRPSNTEKAFLNCPDTGVLRSELQEGKKYYMKDFLLKIFDWKQLKFSIDQNASSEPIFKIVKGALEKMERYAMAFCSEISGIISVEGNPNWQLLASLIEKADSFFVNEINTTCIGPLKEYIKKNKEDFKFRGTVNLIKSQIRLFQEKAQSIILANQVVNGLIETKPYMPFDSETFSSKQIIINNDKPNLSQHPSSISTETQSLQLFVMGKSIPEIAAARSLGIPAIEYHLASFISSGEIDLSDLIPQELLDEVLPRVKELRAPSIAQLRPITGSKLSIGQLQALSVYLKK